MPFGVVYVRSNCITGKKYVGQTRISVESRWKKHIYNSKNSKSPAFNYPLSRAIRKYGEENFTLENVFECETQEELNTKEKELAYLVNSWTPYGYNLKAGDGLGSVSLEVREKLSRANKGKVLSITTKNKISQSLSGNNNPFYGKHHTEEVRNKLSSMNKGKLNPNFGKHRSQETKEKIGVSLATKIFWFHSPSGEEHRVTNLIKFCREHPDNLNESAMRKVFSGERKQHKGWRKSLLAS